ncbi:protein LNK2 isoform X2 [Oryza sativa Japonica Group]|uniref:protein LNK2 isoform X2 n=1 Tax=Oryza sativa subsp. japonica TaxID=39947 RepID=UPI00077536D1|nr:protein LNK2 isoform X8 [Oryza sativa Japonica Group]
MRPLHTWPSRTSTPTARPIILHHASAPPWTPLGGWEGRGERERGEREAQTTTTQVASGGGGEASKRNAILRRVTELEDFLPFPFAVAGDATVGTRGAARIGLSFGCGASGGRHLRRMFEWNDDQQQVGDAIWAEFNENEDHIVPYPKDTEDSALVSVGDQKKNDEETDNIPGLTERSSSGQTEFPVLEKQPASQASEHYSATQLDVESWPDLPSLNATLDRNYSDDNIASTYLDFSSAPSLEKVTGNTTVQLDGETEVFGNDHEEKSNSFLDCDWGNIGDFDDFDRLFSNGDSIFGNEMVADGSNFLSASSDLVDTTVQSIPFPHIPLNKQLSSDHGSSLLINETSGGTTEQESKGDVQKKSVRSRRRTEERGKSKMSNSTSGFSQNQGQHRPASSHSLAKAPAQPLQTPQYLLLHDNKNMGQLQQANQFIFPDYGYPSYQFPGIPLMSNVQAESHQTKPATTNYRTSIDSPKQSSSAEKSQDIPSRPLMMTPQEKIEKLRRRQQMQALIAIQQQQQQFGQDGSGSDTMVPQAYSPKSKNPDSLGSSVVIDDNANKVFSLELIPTGHEEIQKSSGIPDDPFIEEKIYYQLQDALAKLDTRTRRCIRDSLLRLAHSVSERQITSDRSSANKSNKDDDEVSEDTSKRRSPASEAETNTNPIDRIVAHLLFHKPCSKVSTPAKEEIKSSTPLPTEPDSKIPTDAPGGPSENHQNGQEMTLQPSL